jgi:hypothetical protein
MIAIHKYRITLDGDGIEMPAGAEILHADCQGEGIFLWARVDTERPNVRRHIVVVGTGRACPSTATSHYVGTVMMRTLGLVFHVFERNLDEVIP